MPATLANFDAGTLRAAQSLLAACRSFRSVLGAMIAMGTAPAVVAYDGHSRIIDGVLHVWVPNPSDFGSVRTITDNTELFGPDGIPNPDAVHQTVIGDCYFDAPLAAVAMAEPSRLQRMITWEGTGWAVRFAKTSDLQPELVVHTSNTVSKSMQTEAFGELWPMVLEKAFAYARWASNVPGLPNTNTLASLNNGSTVATFARLGYRTTGVQFFSRTIPQILATISDNLANHRPMVLETNAGPLVSNHAYTLVSASTDISGELWFILRNPWGIDGNLGDNVDDGYVTARLSDVLSSSHAFYWGVA